MTTTQTNTQTLFVNLFVAITAEKKKHVASFINDLKEIKDVKSIVSSWHYNDLLPNSRKGYQWELKELKQYLIDRKTKESERSLAKELIDLQNVEQSPDFESITVSIEWKKSRMWGHNPKAEAIVCTTRGCNRYETGSIGGCGYDKKSTAVAEAINQSNSFLKAMYLVKEKNPKMNNRELFGYGSGYGILPRLEGGVGVSCYPKIFETIGYQFKTTASGKSFDVYTVTK